MKGARRFKIKELDFRDRSDKIIKESEDIWWLDLMHTWLNGLRRPSAKGYLIGSIPIVCSNLFKYFYNFRTAKY